MIVDVHIEHVPTHFSQPKLTAAYLVQCQISISKLLKTKGTRNSHILLRQRNVDTISEFHNHISHNPFLQMLSPAVPFRAKTRRRSPYKRGSSAFRSSQGHNRNPDISQSLHAFGLHTILITSSIDGRLHYFALSERTKKCVKKEGKEKEKGSLYIPTSIF